MENEIKIVPMDFYQAAHLTAFINLINAYIEESGADNKPLKGMKKLRMVDTLNNLENNVILFAIMDKELVGLINCYETLSIMRGSKYLLIHDLVVLGGPLREQIENKLLKAAKLIAEQREYPILALQSS